MSSEVAWPAMSLPITPPFSPMKSKVVAALPHGEGWQYEPKWDGLRCVAFRDHDQVALQSKSGQPLTGYFPELVRALRSIRANRFAVDGEIVVPSGSTYTPSGVPETRYSFDDLLQRLHPAESQIEKLARATPASFLLFDLLVDARGRALLDRALAERRLALEAFARGHLVPNKRIRISPATTEQWVVDRWQTEQRGRGVDGIMAKRLDETYRSGERAMQKMKWMRTADCVVGGFRYSGGGRLVGSLLLGAYDHEGLLQYLGFCSSMREPDRPALTKELEALADGLGFTGRSPGGPSRWQTGRSTQRVALDPKLVVEVQYDHFSQGTPLRGSARRGRFRHRTKLERWRPDKAPKECTLDQLENAPGRRLRGRSPQVA